MTGIYLETSLTLSDVEIVNPISNSVAIKKLESLIEKEGLWNPIVIRWLEKDPNAHCTTFPGKLVFKGYTCSSQEWFHIACGNNRLEACRNLGWEKIPIILVTEKKDMSQLCRGHRLDLTKRFKDKHWLLRY